MSSDKLKTLNSLKAFDGESHKTDELSFRGCSHPKEKLEVVSSTQVSCSACGAGWTGPGVTVLVDQFE